MTRSVCFLVVLVGCGGADPLDRVEDIPTWANSASAMGAYETVREPVAFFDQAFTYADPACPIAAFDETAGIATITGDCTDADGRTWTGSASVVRMGTNLRVDLDNFGNDVFGGPIRANGFVVIEEVGAEERNFEVDVTQLGGITTTVLYNGNVVGTYDGPTRWNGSGSVRKSGDFFTEGAIAADTVDQVRDNDACAGEGLSGTTTLTSTEHVVVITYDGETDCDADHSARWSLDGEDQGTIANITCSTGGASGFGALLLVGALVLRRRR